MAHTKQADGGRMFDDSLPALRVNVSTLERIASALAGSALAAWGLSRRSRAGWAGAAFGGALLYRGLSGRCPVYRTLGIDTAPEEHPATSVPEHIGWRSLEGSDIDAAGSVHFHDAPGGATVLKVVLSYSPPGGRVGAAVASILGASPERQIDEDLQRFRQLQDSGMALP